MRFLSVVMRCDVISTREEEAVDCRLDAVQGALLHNSGQKNRCTSCTYDGIHILLPNTVLKCRVTVIRSGCGMAEPACNSNQRQGHIPDPR
jgi:hypothetical protein